MRFQSVCRGDRLCGCCSGLEQWSTGVGQREKIGTPELNFDATVTGTETGDHFLPGMSEQKEADAEENTRGRCRDNAKRAEVE